MEIYLANYNVLSLEKEYKYYYKYLSSEEQEKVNSYVQIQDKARCTLGLILIKGFSYKNLGYCTIDTYEYGKPYIKFAKDYYFNISHSNEIVTIAIDNEEIGIDIEHVRPIRLEYYQNILDDNERHIIEMSENKIEKFYEIWTIKESFSKKVGRGLSIFDEEFSVDYNDNIIKYKNQISYFETIRYNDYIISISSSNEQIKNLNLNPMSKSELKKILNYIK